MVMRMVCASYHPLNLIVGSCLGLGEAVLAFAVSCRRSPCLLAEKLLLGVVVEFG